MINILKLLGIKYELINTFPIEKKVFMEKLSSKMIERKQLTFLETIGILNSTKSVFVGKLNKDSFEIWLRKELFEEPLNFGFAKGTIEENEKHLIVKTKIYGLDVYKLFIMLLLAFVYFIFQLNFSWIKELWTVFAIIFCLLILAIKRDAKNLESLLYEHLLYFTKNEFLNKFKEQIDSFYEKDEVESEKILNDIMDYANLNPVSFQIDFNEIKFDMTLSPISIIVEALSKDTNGKWDQFFIDLIDDILNTAKESKNPALILSNLSYFLYIEENPRPFVLKIIEKLHEALNSDILKIKLAAIWSLPDYLDNISLSNKDLIIHELQQQLYDKNWKVRVVAYKSLCYGKLLPFDYKLSLKDKLKKLILGDPS